MAEAPNPDLQIRRRRIRNREAANLPRMAVGTQNRKFWRTAGDRKPGPQIPADGNRRPGPQIPVDGNRKPGPQILVDGSVQSLGTANPMAEGTTTKWRGPRILVRWTPGSPGVANPGQRDRTSGVANLTDGSPPMKGSERKLQDIGGGERCAHSVPRGDGIPWIPFPPTCT